MREIKFRAWDAEEKKMYPVLRMDFWVSQDGAHKGIDVLVGTSEETEFQGESPLMQYTGLKDNTKWEQLTSKEQQDWLDSGKTEQEWNGKECYWDDWVTDGINPKFLVTSDYHLLARLSEIEFEIVGNKHED